MLKPETMSCQGMGNSCERYRDRYPDSPPFYYAETRDNKLPGDGEQLREVIPGSRSQLHLVTVQGLTRGVLREHKSQRSIRQGEQQLTQDASRFIW